MSANRKTRATVAKISRQDRPGDRAAGSPRPRHHAKTQAAQELARVDKVLLALNRGDPVDRAMRVEIVSALEGVAARQPKDETRERNRRGIAVQTFMAAALARELIDKYHIEKTKAAKAAFESTRDRMGFKISSVGAVARAYRKIRDSKDCSMKTPKGDKISMVLIEDGIIDEALARVRGLAGGGNPPFGIVAVHLSKPVKSGNK